MTVRAVPGSLELLPPGRPAPRPQCIPLRKVFLTMYTNSTAEIVAAALHRVFAGSPYAVDSVELWVALSTEAQRQLSEPVPVTMSWLPVFLHFRQLRTDGEFFPYTGSVRILTGPLTGIIYTDFEDATRAVVAEMATPVSGDDDDAWIGDPANTGTADADGDGAPLMPSWRFRVPSDPDGRSPRAS
ncbi:hypothetical protein [Nocardia brasiliensis]|uniref:hypothetical protein n=1 Tax=Nocardia brasiliensis TaxID=37326 RepID=UPI0018930C6C|nr:hypothetical protein [Nocardia brasiliensis]MBF6545285.1 hypothetical protein [Nocardia brasiliensis]